MSARSTTHPRVLRTCDTATRERSGRARVAAAIDRSEPSDQVLLALMLVDRLSVREAARVLGLTATRTRARYRALFTRLGRAWDGEHAFLHSRRTAAGERLRRAS